MQEQDNSHTWPSVGYVRHCGRVCKCIVMDTGMGNLQGSQVGVPTGTDMGSHLKTRETRRVPVAFVIVIL